jgi:putative NIF3 family GTP cyclohydrolase 1 type 2
LRAFVVTWEVNAGVELHTSVVLDVVITSFTNARAVGLFHVHAGVDAGPGVGDVALARAVGLDEQDEVLLDVRDFNRLRHWRPHVVSAEVNLHAADDIRAFVVHTGVAGKTNVALVFQLEVNVDVRVQGDHQVACVSGNVRNVNLVKAMHDTSFSRSRVSFAGGVYNGLHAFGVIITIQARVSLARVRDDGLQSGRGVNTVQSNIFIVAAVVRTPGIVSAIKK